MDVAVERGQPLLAYDLWTHALDAAVDTTFDAVGMKTPIDDLGQLIKRFFAVVNWNQVSKLFEASRKDMKPILHH